MKVSKVEIKKVISNQEIKMCLENFQTLLASMPICRCGNSIANYHDFDGEVYLCDVCYDDAYQDEYYELPYANAFRSMIME